MLRILGLVGIVCGVGLPGWAAASSFMLIYSGNLDGELEPCGCSAQGDLGGIRRRATVMDKLRQAHPGGFYFSAGGLLVSETSRDRLKSEYILKGYAKLHYDAIAVQWQDLAYGGALLQDKRWQLPWVASNWRGGGFFAQKRISKAGQTLVAFSWLDLQTSPFRKMQGDFNKVSADRETLAQNMKRAKQQGALTLLSTALPAAKAKLLIKLANIDLLVVKAQYEQFQEPVQQGHTLILQAGSRGMRLGKLLLQRDSGGKILSWQHEVIAMPSSVPNHPDFTAWYDDYNAKVKAAYLKRVALRRAKAEGINPFAGAESCAQCHAPEHTIWLQSKHAQAFTVLEEVRKSFDPDCIGCHTVGFNQPGGFVDAVFTEQLQHVQCESCHGAAQAHVDSGGKIPVRNHNWSNAKICNQCHNPAHSPGFQYSQYWPRIAHGGRKGITRQHSE